MTDTTTPPERASAAPRLSIAQMLGVMRVEFHRARVQRSPLCCLMIAIDGLEGLVLRGGYEAKSSAVGAVYLLLRERSKELGFFGMALMSGDRIMALFPGTPAARMTELGEALCSAARTLNPECAGEDFSVTLSLGASHNLLAETNSSFEGLVEMAGRALYLATEAKGDRYVMWRAAEAEIEGLRVELEESRQSFRAEHELMREELSEIGGLQQAAIVDKIQKIFASVPRTSEIESLEKQILEMALAELYEERQKAVQAQMAEHGRKIEQLERRIAKLTEILGVTEEELKRVMALKHIDAGVASIFRTVQGLSADDAQAQHKKAMMAEIFEQNLAFQKGDEPKSVLPSCAALSPNPAAEHGAVIAG